MKKYRRVEISAFRRRVTITAGRESQEPIDAQVNATDSPVTINIESPDGQEILLEAIRLLEEKLSK